MGLGRTVGSNAFAIANVGVLLLCDAGSAADGGRGVQSAEEALRADGVEGPQSTGRKVDIEKYFDEIDWKQIKNRKQQICDQRLMSPNKGFDASVLALVAGSSESVEQIFGRGSGDINNAESENKSMCTTMAMVNPRYNPAIAVMQWYSDIMAGRHDVSTLLLAIVGSANLSRDPAQRFK